ncbi:hypothetical protein D3C76_1514450 [compost metagenome]
MRCLDDVPQQVEGKSGVYFIGFGGMISPAVVALGEYGDGIHMSQLQHFLKLFLVKLSSDVLNGLGGVKI